jgi:hypothetical protein
MSLRIVRRAEREPFEAPPLPSRLSSQELRAAFRRFGQPAVNWLGPGEHMISGRRFYSAARLDPTPLGLDEDDDKKGGDGGRDGQDHDHHD